MHVPHPIWLHSAKITTAKIFLSNGEKKVSAASIIHVLTLGVKTGTELEVIAEGEDEATAVEDVVKFIAELED